jgi:hypothetical protein
MVPFGELRPGGSETKMSTSRESAFAMTARHRASVVRLLENGTSPFLPNEKGEIDTELPVNVIRDTPYKGPNVLILKSHQKANGFPTAEYVSIDNLRLASQKAGVTGPITAPNTHPVTISYLDDNNNVKFINLINIAEAADKKAVWDYRNSYLEGRFNNRQGYLAREAEKRGESFETRRYYPPRHRKNGPVFDIPPEAASRPEKYLGHILAAMSAGSPKCYAGRETAQAFKENAVSFLAAKETKNGKEYSNPYRIYELGHKASAECKDILRNLFRRPEQARPEPEAPRQRNRNRKRESPGMSM